MTTPWGPGRPVHEQNEFVAAREAEKVQAVVQDARAARVVAGNSVDAEDCRSLLLMLGLQAGGDAG